MVIKKKKALPEEVDVLIVGAGLAGLSCAVGLSDQGLRVAVLEKSRLLGGRASSWKDPQTGDPIHIGPHILLSAYPNMISLMKRLGTENDVLWMGDRFIHLVDGPVSYEVSSSKLPPPFHFLPSMLSDPFLSKRDLLGNARVTWLVMQLGEEDFLALDDLNAAAFLRGMGVTPHAMERFWSFVCMSILNVPLELCSASALLRFYKKLTGSGNITIGLPTKGLGDLFAPQAKALVERKGGHVLLQTEVKSFLGSGRRVVGVELADGQKIRAQHVVCTLPPHQLRRLVRKEWLELPVFSDLVHFEPCPYISTYLWFDRKLTDLKFWARVHRSNDLNCDFYDLSNIYPGWEFCSSLITTNCIYSHRAKGLSDEQIVQQTLDELAEFLPEAREATVTHSVVNRIEMAIHCPFPGTERKRPPIDVGLHGFLLAGDWVKTGIPACMESAVQSGFMVAEELVRRKGRSVQLVQEPAGVQGIARVVDRVAQRLPGQRLPRWLRPIAGRR